MKVTELVINIKKMSSFRVVSRVFCSAADTAANPATISRWEQLKNSKAGEKLITRLMQGFASLGSSRNTTGLGFVFMNNIFMQHQLSGNLILVIGKPC